MGQRMTTGLLEARRQLQQPLGIVGVDGRHQRPAKGESAGFIKHHLIETSCRFEHIASSEQPAPPGRQTCGHRDHSRCRQSESTGAGHHQHGDRQLQRQTDRSLGTAAETGMVHGMRHHPWRGSLQHLWPEVGTDQPPEQEGGQGQSDHDIAKTTSHPVRQPLDGSPSCLGLLHQLDDPGESRLRTHPLHLHGQRCLEIQASGGELRARFRLQGERFAREAGHVHG